MFVDASALVAIMTGEPDAEALTSRLNEAKAPITSPIAVFETIAALSRKRRGAFETLEFDLTEFLSASNIAVVPVSNETGWDAAEIHLRYGKRSGHPARLNMGDCFAYAMAKQHKVPLLYKGDDFALTDLA
jgi:ribonuclease VapC